MLLRFGHFEIDTAQAELRGPDGPIPVEPKTFDLLLFLAENPDRILTRDEMIARVWGGRAVSDSAVATVLKQVRKALGDSAADPHLLRTVHGRGHPLYRRGAGCPPGGTGTGCGTGCGTGGPRPRPWWPTHAGRPALPAVPPRSPACPAG